MSDALKEAVIFILGVLVSAEEVDVIGIDGSDKITQLVISSEEKEQAMMVAKSLDMS